MFKVSEQLKAGELPVGNYDFIYAFSVFTHLNREAFLSNLELLSTCLRAGGRLYLTVRHEDFLAVMVDQQPSMNATALHEQGFINVVYPGLQNYGETICTTEFLQKHCATLGALEYLGLVDVWQHLYVITRP